VTGFEDVIPMLGWALFAIGLVIAFTLASRFIESIKNLRTGNLFAGAAEEKEAEGLWYNIGQVLRLLLYFFVFLAAATILNYLLTSPANTSIYDQILDPSTGFTVPIVGLVVAMYLIKMTPYLMGRAMKSVGPEDEHDTMYK
jgi:hypothetical protein